MLVRKAAIDGRRPDALMTEAILKIYGERVEAEGQGASPVVATIFAPEQSDNGDSFCRVSLPTLFEDEKRIFGADAEQAQELACLFARDLLSGFDIAITAEKQPDKT